MSVDPNTKQMIPQSSRLTTIRTFLETHKKQIGLALPRHMTSDRMLRIALTSISKTPELLNCDHVSLLGAIIQSAQLGLEPDGVLGHAYLVPFGGKCTLIPGYRGLVDLARRSGQLVSIQAHAVHDEDVFEFEYGLAPKLRHVPSRSDQPGNVVAFYAVAQLKDGGIQFEVMWKRQVDAIRARSKAGKSGPWVTDYEQMGCKTVLRRLTKLLPCSPEMARIVELDEQADMGVDQRMSDVVPIPTEEPTIPGNGSTLDRIAQASAPEPEERDVKLEEHQTISGDVLQCQWCNRNIPASVGLSDQNECPDCEDKRNSFEVKKAAEIEKLKSRTKK